MSTQAIEAFPSKAVRLFTCQPDRLAAAWRRVCFSQGDQTEASAQLLDAVVEPLVREIGNTLAGARGSAWARCAGVLRVAPSQGTRRLYDEFAALRRCLHDALDVIGAQPGERAAIDAAVDEAIDSSVAIYESYLDPQAVPPKVPFGGLVVELFDRSSLAAALPPPSGSHSTVH